MPFSCSDKLDEGYEDDFASAASKSSKVDALPARLDMRTFVFSATMSKDLQRNLKKAHRRYKPGQPEDGMSSLGKFTEALYEVDGKLTFLSPLPQMICYSSLTSETPILS